MAKAVSKVIDEILSDFGDRTDGTGFLTRAIVRDVINVIQRQISLETENILATTDITTIALDSTEVTVDSSGNLIRVRSCQRLQTYEGPVKVWTEDQIEEYDPQWQTREGELIRALIPDIADAGKAVIYPKINNANNTLKVKYIKLSGNITAEFTEAGDAANQLSNWIINGLTSANSNSFLLYYELTATGGRTVNIYKDSAGSNLVATGVRSDNGKITLSASNDSGLSGYVTVAYSAPDTTISANILTFDTLEIADVDSLALSYGVKWTLLDTETDRKDGEKASYYRGLYGFDVSGEGRHTGELATIIKRISKIRGSTYSFCSERAERDRDDYAFVDNTPIT